MSAEVERPHRTEAFLEDGSRVIGVQCLVCGWGRAGFASIAEAEDAGDAHEDAQ